MVTRRKFLGAIIGTVGYGLSEHSNLTTTADARPGNESPDFEKGFRTIDRSSSVIDRAAVVKRHNPIMRKLEPLSPLSVGNGEFAFTCDLTGLQTFPEEYEKAMPLCTMSQWGWHTTPLPGGLDPDGLRLKNYDTHGRNVGYHTSPGGQTELFNWLRENPHRLHLGRIELRMIAPTERSIQASDLSNVEQQLNLWTGVLTSRFTLEGKPVVVTSAVHPTIDLIAVKIESKLIADNRLGVRFTFPYGSSTMQAADWSQAAKHKTTVTRQSPIAISLRRKLDADQYHAAIKSKGGTIKVKGVHEIVLTPTGSTAQLEFTATFASEFISVETPNVARTFAASASHWERFWTEGGAIELADSSDPRAHELERRVVLSQYLTAIQCSGSKPPQETGLTLNSWYGKSHLEMHWWHGAHFALWKRLPFFERSLGWYNKILPSARELAKSQGYAGVRWPKMVGPEGRDSPSPIGSLLIWQQPHPIFYAELCYKVRPTRRTLERYREIVFESAAFMASFAYYERDRQRFVLGPPVIPAQENHPPNETWNPTFELGYWIYALKVAQQWRERLGLRRNTEWDRVLNNLSPMPIKDGVYLAHENCPQTYTERNEDHPSMLCAYGMLPGDGVDQETMRRTLHKVMKEWQWDKTWGWDYPVTAMTAARLGETAIAVDALTMQVEKNRYLANGHNWQRPNLPCYLPGNGGLLYAVALMAGGWQGAPANNAPGFPSNGSWKVRSEGLDRALLSQI